jgi:hypothetical protein
MREPKAASIIGAGLAVLIAASSLFAMAGCGSENEVLPEIIPYSGSALIPTNIPMVSEEPDPDKVELTGVKIAADGPMIMVGFKAPAKLIQSWGQGSIYLLDETTGQLYSQIVVAPVIGPLFSKPLVDNGSGYAMLDNYDQGVKAGSTVTVILGKYKREHVKVG